jgi:aldose 1-epimerase
MLREKNSIDRLTLTSGADRCDLLPALGGSIAAWSTDGRDILRPASAASIAAEDPFGMGGFPLVPYSNRIGNGSFEWEGRRHSLTLNFQPEPHAIHGVGFERPWQVRSSAAGSATLTLRHHPGASWPFAFEAEQCITLAERTLTIEMSAHNLEARPVPLGFGYHPYFPRDGARLEFRAESVWLLGDDGLPSLRVKPFGKFDYSRSTSVARGDIDHCFTGWDGGAEISWPGRQLGLRIEASHSLRCAVVCIRSDLDGFCFEPVPHLNDALNRPDRTHAMPVIAPGGRFDATIRLTALDLAKA